jgi:hypothetical protein
VVSSVRAKRNLIAGLSTLGLGFGAAVAMAAEPAEELGGSEQPSERRYRSMEAERSPGGDDRSPGGRAGDGASSSTADGVPRGTLEAIAACESGGDPSAVSADGTYRGKYQFDRSTWTSVGGSGDPAAAPEAEQDRRAALLYRRTGGSAWPNCAA